MQKNSLELCIWKELSKAKDSSSFEAAEDPTQKTYKCKYVCDGYDLDCDGYIASNINTQDYKIER